MEYFTVKDGKCYQTDSVYDEKIDMNFEQEEKQYWQTVDYGEAINSEIRKKYTVSEEFAILRQKEEKPEEYAEYYAYCESCKTFVKEQKQKYEIAGGKND